MLQAHASGLGYPLPAWQFTARRQLHPALQRLIAAAAERGWTSLELHRFMTTPLADGKSAPADLLGAEDEVERILTLFRDKLDEQQRSTELVLGRHREMRRRRPARRDVRAGASR